MDIQPYVLCNGTQHAGTPPPPESLSVATPAEPRGETFFFVQTFVGEKLLKFVEKCR